MAGAQAASPLVRVQGVSKTYRESGPGALAVESDVLDGADLELARGETTSLVGVSGSGKSTLLGLVAGLLLPDAGSITFDDRDITRLGDGERARLRAQRIGVVLQSGNLVPFLTARENVELALELGGRRRSRSRARELLTELGLAARSDHLPRRLSGGEAQRVAVAVALANEPDLLLADEVTGELDSTTAEEVITVILDAWRSRGLTVLFVTHSQELAARAQRHLRLVGGRVLPL